MIAFKSIIKFFAVFCLTYLLLISLISIPGILKTHASIFKKSSDAFISILLPQAYIEFRNDLEDNIKPDIIKISYANQNELKHQIGQAKKQGKTELDFKVNNFEVRFQEIWVLPFIFCVTLILVTPIQMKEKLYALIIGVLLVYGVVLLKLLIYTLFYISSDSLGVYELPPLWYKLITHIKTHFSVGVTLSMVLLIWVMTTMRSDNWRIIIGKVVSNNKKTRK